MRINPVQVILATIAILTTAVLAEVLAPRELMARSSTAVDLEQVIPHKFGEWTFNPNVGVITPSDSPEYVETDANSSRIYAKELTRGYTDARGNLVMLLIAYGPVQNHRLKAHRPEFCYAAAGFLVSQKSSAEVAYDKDVPSLRLTRLITEREKRFEPVTYWLRTGNEIATGIVDQQIIRLKYGLHGIIPDGALVRVSTIGVSADAAFKLQDQFIRELLAVVSPETRRFLIGNG
jgi:EpsI family protein